MFDIAYGMRQRNLRHLFPPPMVLLHNRYPFHPSDINTMRSWHLHRKSSKVFTITKGLDVGPVACEECGTEGTHAVGIVGRNVTGCTVVTH